MLDHWMVYAIMTDNTTTISILPQYIDFEYRNVYQGGVTS